MALASVNIKVTPEELYLKAESVHKKVMKTQKYFEEISNVIGNTKSYWIGDAGEYHRKAFEDKKEDIENILNCFKEHSADLQIIAQQYSDTELKITETISVLPDDVIV